MMIEAYYDESGIHDGAKLCAVGGFYGTHAAWRKFEREWNRIIFRYGLVDHGFHAKRFFARNDKGERVSPYAGWTDDKANRFLDALIQSVMRNRVFPIAHGIIVNHWNALDISTRRWLTGGKYVKGKFVSTGSPNRSYYVPFQFCVLDSAKYSGTSDAIHFFAGLDRTFAGYARVLYKQLLKDGRLKCRPRLGTLSFPLSKDTPGIQAADLLVYQMYEFNRDKLDKKRPVPMPHVLKRLIKNRKHGQDFRLL